MGLYTHLSHRQTQKIQEQIGSELNDKKQSEKKKQVHLRDQQYLPDTTHFRNQWGQKKTGAGTSGVGNL